MPATHSKSTQYDPGRFGGGSVVPYVGAWTAEELLPTRVVLRARGIGYADETLLDRDDHGVLWTRMAARIGAGRPLFTKLHPLRQRRAMRRLLCQVCAKPADRTERGLLWLAPGITPGSAEQDWDGFATIQPPVCRDCARASIRACPALRRGWVLLRAHTRVSGVVGIRFRPGQRFPVPVDDECEVVGYDDPAVRWVQATQLARSLHDCSIVDAADLDG